MRGRIFVSGVLLCLSTGAAADELPICADRPSKSTGECTVPEGRWQVETGLVDWSHDHGAGQSRDFTSFGSTLIKYGISSRADVELGVTPFETSRAHGSAGHESASGFGDTVLRVKYALTGSDAPVLVGLDPFVKLPTAGHRLGNGKVEGGIVVPMSAQLGKSGLTLSVDPEMDVLADEDGHGRHAAMIQVVNLGASLNDKLSVSAELWGQWDWDPTGTTRQTSADGSIAYLVNRNLQLDAGANFGLNRNTPDIELYAGISKRF